MRQKKGFPIWGKLSAKRTDEGKAYVAVIKTGNKANFPLIRRLPILQKKKFGYELFVIKQFITELYFNMHKIFFKQKTAYEILFSDWSSDVCSSDLDATFFIFPIRYNKLCNNFCNGGIPNYAANS